jgi:hypothetical protein
VALGQIDEANIYERPVMLRYISIFVNVAYVFGKSARYAGEIPKSIKTASSRIKMHVRPSSVRCI